MINLMTLQKKSLQGIYLASIKKVMGLAGYENKRVNNMFNLSDAKVAVIGLGYVGLPLAVEFSKKFSTIGFDINKERVKELKSGLDATMELNRDELNENKNIKYSCFVDDLVDCNIYIVTVPTPINRNNKPNLKFIKSASISISKLLKKGDIVVYESTVFPGCTEEVCVPILEKHSNLKFNIDFFCGYSPERINPGDKKNSLVNIKKIVSGSNKRTRQRYDCNST